VVIESTGVTNFEIGDEIYCRVPQEQMGTIAEFVAVNSELVAKKPTNSSFEEGWITVSRVNFNTSVGECRH
jgi:NADPH:quinone reductase-like Zn-dependent oxidoreductase